MFGGTLAKLLDLLFPRSCIGCGAKHELLCETCLAVLPIADNDKENCRARFAYGDKTVRQAIWQLKYKHKRGFGEILGTALGELLLEDLSDLAELENFRNPTLIPVPMSIKRLRERVYNQAELIASAVAKVTSLPLIPKAVIKIKDTPSQVSQHNRTKRLKNLEEAFSILDPALIKNRNIIIIDDVYTTGATMAELTRTLKKSGAKRVLAYTVAH
ncbi:MAG TPA: phosphoribosyltransferase family protein [Candidatus Paceibacterota bacterium]